MVFLPKACLTSFIDKFKEYAPKNILKASDNIFDGNKYIIIPNIPGILYLANIPAIEKPVINDLKNIIIKIIGIPIIDIPNNQIDIKNTRFFVKLFLNIRNFEDKSILLKLVK